MKKVICLLLVLLLAVSAIPIVVAEEDGSGSMSDAELIELEDMLDSFLETHEVAQGNLLLTQLETAQVSVDGSEHDIVLVDVTDNEDNCGIQVDDNDVKWIDIDSTEDVDGVEVSVHYVEIVKGQLQDLDICEISVEGAETEADDSATPELISENTDSEDGDDQQTENEVRAMTNMHGREMRLFQLERAITRNILKGEEVVAAVVDKGEDASELESILAELEAVKEEVQAVDPASEDAVQQFVDLKKDSIDLAKQFRDTARELITGQDLVELRNRIRTMERSELDEITDKIKQAKNDFNAELLQEVLDTIGTDNTDLVERVQNGQATMAEVKQAIRDNIKSLESRKRNKVITEIRENTAKRVINARDKYQNARVRSLDNKEQRISNRLEKLAEREGPIANAIRSHEARKLEIVGAERLKVQERIDARNQRIENFNNSNESTEDVSTADAAE